MSQLRSRLPSLAALVPFEAAARHASFSRAAAELNLTQAAVSRQIRLLEDSLGARLFERRRHGVELTPAGGELANEIAPALRMIAAASDRARASMRSANTVSVFCDVSIAGAFVIPRLGAMRRDHPDLVIRLVTSSELLEATSEPFDVGLTTGRPRGDRFDVVEICSEEIFPVASPSLARKLPKRPTLAKLSAAPLLHFSQPGRNWLDWPRFLAAFGVEAKLPAEGFAFTSYSVLLDAAEAGHGIALGWRLSIENRLRQGSLVRVSGAALPIAKGLAAYLPRRQQRPEPVHRFLGWLVAETANNNPR